LPVRTNAHALALGARIGVGFHVLALSRAPAAQRTAKLLRRRGSVKLQDGRRGLAID